MSNFNGLSQIIRGYRRLWPALWRRLLSPCAAWLISHVWDVHFQGRPTLVGWPVFKGEGRVELGSHCVLVSSPLGNPIGLFRPCIIEAIGDAAISIGHGFSASGLCLVAQSGIRIGSNVSVGANVTIVDTDFHPVTAGARTRGEAASSRPICIEDDVWIGMGAIILKGVRIGRGAVIGAGVVITKDVPAHAVAVGSTARIILSDTGAG